MLSKQPLVGLLVLTAAASLTLASLSISRLYLATRQPTVDQLRIKRVCAQVESLRANPRTFGYRNLYQVMTNLNYLCSPSQVFEDAPIVVESTAPATPTPTPEDCFWKPWSGPCQEGPVPLRWHL